jgi:hypothetical protein
MYIKLRFGPRLVQFVTILQMEKEYTKLFSKDSDLGVYSGWACPDETVVGQCTYWMLQKPKEHFLFSQTHNCSYIFRWKIRIGNDNLNSNLNASNVLVLDIIESNQHPSYDGSSSYYDIAVLTTNIVKFSTVFY